MPWLSPCAFLCQHWQRDLDSLGLELTDNQEAPEELVRGSLGRGSRACSFRVQLPTNGSPNPSFRRALPHTWLFSGHAKGFWEPRPQSLNFPILPSDHPTPPCGSDEAAEGSIALEGFPRPKEQAPPDPRRGCRPTHFLFCLKETS